MRQGRDVRLTTAADARPAARPLFAARVLLPALARANHGTGTSGGRSTTFSGETLEQGRIEPSLRNDATGREDVLHSNGELLEPSGRPGTGAFDGLLGAG